MTGGATMCSTGNVCTGGQCLSVTDISCGGATVFVVGFEDANQCGLRVAPLHSSSEEGALLCAQHLLMPGERVHPMANATLHDFEMCLTTAGSGRTTHTVRAFDDFGANRCANWTQCGAAGCSNVAYGPCL